MTVEEAQKELKLADEAHAIALKQFVASRTTLNECNSRREKAMEQVIEALRDEHEDRVRR